MNNKDAGSSLKIFETLEAHRGEKHPIALQDFPDPDAIASAFAHQLMSAAFDIECDIVHGGKVSRQQNIALIKLLGIELSRFGCSADFQQYAGAVYVDNQGTTAEETVRHLEAIGLPALIMVDRHELQHRLASACQDIRRDFGSTSTIYAGELEQGLVEVDKSRREHVKVATALTHGILTGTNGFMRACPEDFHPAASLSRFRDADLLEQMMNPARSRKTMKVIHRALEDRLTVEGFSIAGVGYLRAEDRDAIPQTSDFPVTEEGIHTAIVYGMVTSSEAEEAIMGSVRTVKITLDPDEFIKRIFGRDSSGHYYGGGKSSAGGFGIPVWFRSGGEDEEHRERKWQVFNEEIKQKLFAGMGVESVANHRPRGLDNSVVVH